MKKFQEKLGQLEERGRLRSLNLPAGIDLTSNDYLGLRGHPALRRAAMDAIGAGIDLGAGGSRLLRGHQSAHENLEIFAAGFFNAEKTLYFSSGYQANFALFTTLPSRHDVILYDSLIHASARDGINASHAKSLRIPHNDLDAYETALKRLNEGKNDRRVWLAVESVYSMDGDMAPLRELGALCRRYDAMLVVDEAHATGVLGYEGRGLSFGMPHHNRITLHTCGKALGVAGGLVCAPGVLIDYMINAARPFIFSTAPPPLQALLTHEALKLAQGREGQSRREKLAALCKTAQKLFGGHGTHIVPIILGEDRRAVAVAEHLQGKGYDIRAIRPPSVAEGTARLRLSLSAALDEDDLHRFAAHLKPQMERRAA
jgi:8-amino-7-oxononanoate synthase